MYKLKKFTVSLMSICNWLCFVSQFCLSVSLKIGYIKHSLKLTCTAKKTNMHFLFPIFPKVDTNMHLLFPIFPKVDINMHFLFPISPKVDTNIYMHFLFPIFPKVDTNMHFLLPLFTKVGPITCNFWFSFSPKLSKQHLPQQYITECLYVE